MTKTIVRSSCFIAVLCAVIASFAISTAIAGDELTGGTHERMFEWTFDSRKTYRDGFNDVDVDVIFEGKGGTWRVPAFWRGTNKWTVRFAPSSPGDYRYRLESTDRDNQDINGREGLARITAYRGPNPLLQHGMFKVSATKRHFEHADGTPFYWLGDTWWAGLSTRLSWDGFQKLTADRKEKGFTVVQLVAGMKDPDERPPIDPGYCNEGGCVWDSEYERINPRYFDYADRRVAHLIDAGIAPAIVGAWVHHISTMGVTKINKHWRYVIARYAAYPVFWAVGGEVFDPTPEIANVYGIDTGQLGHWTQVARYVRSIDPMNHPMTAHEANPEFPPLQDENLGDFRMFQPAHFGWPSIAVEIAQLNMHYVRTDRTQPLVVSEIGFEHVTGEHLDDFQRMAFWLGMLNGAAGYSYGADGIWSMATSDKPFPNIKIASFVTWEEAMSFPGSYQVGIGSKLLRKYPWWRFEPQPGWVTPRGTTLLEPRSANGKPFYTPLMGEWPRLYEVEQSSIWKEHSGTIWKPYAAGIPGLVRVIYIPRYGVYDVMKSTPPPTALQLEDDVRYRAFYWDPILGVKVDLGEVARPPQGEVLFSDDFEGQKTSEWARRASGGVRDAGTLRTNNTLFAVTRNFRRSDYIVSVEASGCAQAGIVLRYRDDSNYLRAVYSPTQKQIYFIERNNGKDGTPLGVTSIDLLTDHIRLRVETRGKAAIFQATDDHNTFSTPIVDIGASEPGHVGLLHDDDGLTQAFDNFEIRSSPMLHKNLRLEKRLFDARGTYRGALTGFGWDDYAETKLILLDAYRPPMLPSPQDWLLVLERM